jgi:hypothetical protein
MKPTAAMISTLAVAYAASPDHSFNIPVWQTAGAKNCRGANTMTVTSTPEALTWYFYDMETTYPGDSQTTSDVGFCVMENEIGDGPPDWRFAVDTIEISGSGKLTGGAWIDSLVTVLSMDLGYPVDPSLPLAEQEWALRVGKIVCHFFNIHIIT